MSQTPRVARFIPSLLALIALAPAAFAQDAPKIQFPEASQRANVKQRVGLTDVEIDYARPNKNEREIYGSLVPHGKLWRTGANAPTRIKFSNDVQLDGKPVPAGEYALFTIPNENEWTVILYRDAKVQGVGDYKEENDAARLTVKPVKLNDEVETFTIGLANVKGAAATLHLDWDRTRVPVQLTTGDTENVKKQLAAALAAGTVLDPFTAFRAAVFYHDEDMDMAQAGKWIDQALEKNPNAYFMHMRRAQIQQRLGNQKEAAASAQRAIEILKQSKDPDQGAINQMQRIIDGKK
jgi:tetratricopeptide (TPR) repeat protein